MSCCAATVTAPDYLQQAAAREERLAQDRVIAASIKLGSGTYRTDLIVPEMHCAGCISSIERELAGLGHVEQVRANLSLKTVSVIWSPQKGSSSAIMQKLSELGFEHHLSDLPGEPKRADAAQGSLLLALAVAGFAAANIMLLSVSVWSGADAETTRLFHLISGLIAIPAVAFSGRPFFYSAYKSLASGRLNMDVPISLAVLMALGMSIFESLTGGQEAYFDASVTLLFFLLIGRYLDRLMRNKARGAVARLYSLSAKDGVLVDANGNISHIPLQDIKPGIRLRVFAGERFPVNGRIVFGSTDLDRSHVTGESDPVHAGVGDVIEAGTLNLTGAIDVEARTTVGESFVGEIKNMIEVAEQGRGSYVRIADRMARIYAPAVHLLALITFIGWMIVSGGDWQTSLYTSIAVLIVTCPCALGLAVPVAHVIGANRLMQNGILMRDGAALERLSETTTVVFDKTGTLTTENPKVVSVHGRAEDFLPLLKALAIHSRHPAAKSIDGFLGEIEKANLDEVHEVSGHGLEALYNGTQCRLGKPEWVDEIASSEVEDLDVYSVSFGVSGQNPVHFVIEEALRDDAKSAVEHLKNYGLRLEILSGDRQSKVSQIARKLGISDFSANQKPRDKFDYINSIQNRGEVPLMVGDGVNDAPALAAGNVSIVPASASEIGRHAADFVFIRPSLGAVAVALDVAKYTGRIVRQNFALAIAYNCVAIPLAMAGYVTPLVAAIAMSASSILVVANSLRINFEHVGIRNTDKKQDPQLVSEIAGSMR